MNLILSVNNVATSGGGGGGPTFTITGSGFGTRSSLTPLFYRFFAPGDFSNGDSAATAGYNAYAVGSPAGAFVDTADSFVSGYGCIKHETNLGSTDSFPHIYPLLSGLSERQIFQSYYFRCEKISGTDTTPRQIKGPRYSYSAEYSGAPRIISSLYPASDFASYDRTQVGFFDSSNADISDSDAGIGSAYKSGWRSAGWNSIETWADFGTVGASDGFHKIWVNCARIPAISGWMAPITTDAMPVRTSASHLINYVSLFPGYDAIQAGNRYRFKFCEHVVDTTASRVVVGNASTWDNCTHRQYMIPTAWADGSVTATWRPLGFATSGQTVYGYVVNSSGAVSAATSLVVP